MRTVLLVFLLAGIAIVAIASLVFLGETISEMFWDPISEEFGIGHPLETAALNANIAMSKTAIDWIRGGNPLLVLTILLPFAVAITNSAAWLFAALSRGDDLMVRVADASSR